jgi:hypothetical protein
MPGSLGMTGRRDALLILYGGGMNNTFGPSKLDREREARWKAERSGLHTPDMEMYIGKHKGKQIGKIPNGYWRWFIAQPWAADWPGLLDYAKNAVAGEKAESEIDDF